MLNSLKNINEKLNNGILIIAGVLLIFSLFLIVFNGIIRIFTSPIASLVEIVSWCAAIVTVFSLGATQISKGHVFIDILFQKFPNQVKRIIDIVLTILALAFFIITLIVMTQFAFELKANNALSGTLQIQYWPVVFFAAIGFVGIITALITDIAILIGGKEVHKQWEQEQSL